MALPRRRRKKAEEPETPDKAAKDADVEEAAADAAPEADAKAESAATPDAALVFADRMLAIDHLEENAYLLALSTPETEAEARSWLAETAERNHL